MNSSAPTLVPTRPPGDSTNAPASTAFVAGQTRRVFNVIDYGASTSNSSADNNIAFAAAVAAAVAVKGFVYVPFGTYSGNFVFTELDGFGLVGDGIGSKIVAPVNTVTVDITGVVGINDFTISDIYLAASGASGIGLRIRNANWFNINSVRVDGPLNGIVLESAAAFNIVNVQAYGSPAVTIGQGAGQSNSGPGYFSGGQIGSNSSPNPALVITDDPLGILLEGTHIVANGTSSCAVSIDGPASGTPVGSITFKEIHFESTYNTTNTLACYELSKNRTCGSVKIEGGNAWGQGDGVNYCQDFVRIFDARSVVVRDTLESKLTGVNGFSRSIIRLEAGVPAAGSFYYFSNNIADISGALYSDANGILTGWLRDASNNGPILAGSRTVAQLPTAANYKGISATVSDANATTFWTIVAGGGANIIRVTSDGTNWRIG